MTKKMQDFTHFHMLLTESMTRTNFEDADDCDLLETPYELLDTPYGLFRYISACALFQRELLETQLNQVDLPIEPKVHKRLMSLLNKVCKLWNFSTDCECL
jgi:hypothetical protein